jgi:antitoxin CptB
LPQRFEPNQGHWQNQRDDAETLEMTEELINERDLSKLRWRCRRGLLENDLFIEHFFDKYASNLTVKQAQGLTALMSLSDNDLLDLNLARKSLEDLIPENQELDCPEAREVLAMLRSKVVDGIATLI